jgi:predicted RNA-binding Zn ribbon-like protein
MRYTLPMRTEPVFELSGGHPALDFTNTVDNRPSPRRKELLTSWGDLIAWARQARLLSSAQAQQLSRRAQEAPAQARAFLRDAVKLREALYQTLSARAAGAPAPPAALQQINSVLPAVLKRSRIVRKGDGFEWEFSGGAGEFDRLLWTVGRTIVELLTSEELSLVRECAANECGWLFLDLSRNHSRRWCNMRICGNRDKVRRFRRKARRR